MKNRWALNLTHNMYTEIIPFVLDATMRLNMHKRFLISIRYALERGENLYSIDIQSTKILTRESYIISKNNDKVLLIKAFSIIRINLLHSSTISTICFI